MGDHIHPPTPTTTTLLFAILITLILSISAQHPQVPCLFFFGDSQFDNGNNNALFTSARVDYQPYGIDFPTGPTGRFANGPNIPDYIAQLLNFPNPIPPYVMTTRASNLSWGVNYASGLAGILTETGALSGDRFPMSRQLRYHNLVISRIALQQGRTITAVRNEYLSRCVYVVNIGSNDYLNNYLLPISINSILYNPAQFAERLMRELSGQLRTLYNQGARKVAVFGVGLLGCVPQQLNAGTPSNATGCVDSVNNIVLPFNDQLVPTLIQLNSELTNARFTYINATSIAMGDPRLSGIRVSNRPCCNVVGLTGLCVPNSIPCSNRNEYAFWDNYHTTSLVNSVTAARAYNATLPTDATPVDIRRLAQP